LRAPLAAQLDRAQGVIVVGTGDVVRVVAAARKRALPVFGARLLPDMDFVASLKGARLLAFAGIGDPDKFFATLREAGAAVAVTRSFDDHHRYTKADVQALCGEADRARLVLVTTEKDIARMHGDDDAAPLVGRARALPVTLAFDDRAGFWSLLRDQLARARAPG
jgi:tetraacyldisaccharide 4'-kinase